MSAEELGWIGFSMVVISGILMLLFIVGMAAALARERRQRKWEERTSAMIDAVDALLLAKRLREDREVANLDACWELPTAAGSWTRRGAA